ncbi:hypothetical protein GCM10009741_09390 [Kribbella lupini]|uniref:PH (Pleckstrin Homology) domain-containing protein n=1 Tax=Kribbella lupini TaxID=291602 RepID=A0ABN2A826_9ACTN
MPAPTTIPREPSDPTTPAAPDLHPHGRSAQPIPPAPKRTTTQPNSRPASQQAQGEGTRTPRPAAAPGSQPAYTTTPAEVSNSQASNPVFADASGSQVTSSSVPATVSGFPAALRPVPVEPGLSPSRRSSRRGSPTRDAQARANSNTRPDASAEAPIGFAVGEAPSLTLVGAQASSGSRGGPVRVRNETPVEARATAPVHDEQLEAPGDVPAYEGEASVHDTQFDVEEFDVEPEELLQEFTVRSSQKVHGGIAVGALLVAIGFATSASTSPTGVLRWFAAAAFAALAVVCARALTVGDMLVADRVGIRLRIGDEWIGTRWEEIEEVTVLRRRHPLDDGRIAVHLLDPGPVLAAMPAATRRTTDANRRLTGTSLAVPFGLTARPSNGEVVQALHMLADARCPVREQI